MLLKQAEITRVMTPIIAFEQKNGNDKGRKGGKKG